MAVVEAVPSAEESVTPPKELPAKRSRASTRAASVKKATVEKPAAESLAVPLETAALAASVPSNKLDLEPDSSSTPELAGPLTSEAVEAEGSAELLKQAPPAAPEAASPGVPEGPALADTAAGDTTLTAEEGTAPEAPGEDVLGLQRQSSASEQLASARTRLISRAIASGLADAKGQQRQGLHPV